MKTAPTLCLLLVSLAGCDKVSALFKHGEEPAAPTTAASASAAPSASAAAPPDAPAFAGFEGEVDLLMKGKSMPKEVPLNLVVKNDVVRVDLPTDVFPSPDVDKFTGGGKVYGVLKASQKQLTVILDGKKQAIVISLDGLGDRMKAFHPQAPGAPGAPAAPPADPPKVTKTDKTDKVAGLACQIWEIVNANKSKVDLCVANEAASFFQLPVTGLPTEHAWALELVDGKHFPLRAVMTDKDGGDGGTLEVTKLDKHAVDASVFEVPAGYKQMTIDEMFQGLGAAPPMPSGVPDTPVPGPHKGHGKHHKH